MVEAKKRIEFIDLAKGVCILQVVILHFLDNAVDYLPFLDYLRYLRMPLYFCLSGLFYKDYGSMSSFWKKKINKILIPFVAWYLISYLLLAVRDLIIPAPSETGAHILDIFYQRPLFNNPLWFLLALFWCNVIFNLIQANIKSIKLQVAAVGFVTGFGNVMALYEFGNPFYMVTACSCMPFFCLGYFLKKTAILYEDTDRKKDWMLLGFGALSLVLMALMPLEIPHFSYHENSYYSEGNPLFFYMFAGIFVVSTMLLCKFIKKLPYISYIGRYSIIVLVTHILVYYVVTGVADKVLHLQEDNPLLLTIEVSIVLLSMLIVIPFCKKFLPYICAQKEITRKKMSDTQTMITQQ